MIIQTVTSDDDHEGRFTKTANSGLGFDLITADRTCFRFVDGNKTGFELDLCRNKAWMLDFNNLLWQDRRNLRRDRRWCGHGNYRLRWKRCNGRYIGLDCGYSRQGRHFCGPGSASL